jgi:hypothetical protein
MNQSRRDVEEPARFHVGALAPARPELEPSATAGDMAEHISIAVVVPAGGDAASARARMSIAPGVSNASSRTSPGVDAVGASSSGRTARICKGLPPEAMLQGYNSPRPHLRPEKR